MSINIRRERPADIEAIFRIEAAAFEGEPHAELVNQLRADGALLLSHVAVLNEKIVGHAAYSLLTVTDGDIVRHFPGLGPIGVTRPIRAVASGQRWCAPDWGRCAIWTTGCFFWWGVHVIIPASGISRPSRLASPRIMLSPAVPMSISWWRSWMSARSAAFAVMSAFIPLSTK